MIKATELRIGNYLSNCDQTVIVLSIAREYEKHDVELGYFKDSIGFNRNLKDKNIYPIELAHDWFLKLGFFCHDFNTYKEYNHNDCYFYVRKCGDEYYITPDEEHIFGEAFKYVHQLQNKFFAIYNQELVIK